MKSRRSSVTVRRAMQMGLEHHRAGRVNEAERIYRQVLAADPKNAEALYLLGAIAQQAGQNGRALESYDRALAIKPDHADALCGRGNVLQALSRHEQALSSYDAALKIRPGYAEAHNNRGHALSALGRHAEALASYEGALSIRPDYAEALVNRAHALSALGRREDALEGYERALRIHPEHAGLLLERGNALLALGRYGAALDSYDRALAIRPDLAAALNNRGNALQELRRYDEALASYDSALALQADHAQTLNNRGLVLALLRREDEALETYDRALAIAPGDVRALSNRGLALEALGRPGDALESYERALAIDPHCAEAWSHRGLALVALGRHAQALESYARALAIDPEYAEAHWNRSLCLLVTGDFERGWREYEWRWRWKHFSSAKREFAQPLWLGEHAVEGATILLHAEQGLGDTIQFCRYATLLARRGATVLLEAQPQLKALLAPLEGAHRVLASGEPVPRFDLHCPLMSLPLAFRTRLETVPRDVPYLSVDPRTLAEWNAKLGEKRAMRIGVSWSGNRSHRYEPHRSLPLALLVDAIPAGVEIHTLQTDLRPEDQAVLDRRPDIRHFGENFAETAALAMQMDLVISVDTSIAHLAGALGRPVWILLSARQDWRWLIDRDDSPWYPTARLFRQRRLGDWESVLRMVGDRLRELLG